MPEEKSDGKKESPVTDIFLKYTFYSVATALKVFTY